MSFVFPRVRTGSDVPTVHAANAVYALNEVRARRGGAGWLLMGGQRRRWRYSSWVSTRQVPAARSARITGVVRRPDVQRW